MTYDHSYDGGGVGSGFPSCVSCSPSIYRHSSTPSQFTEQTTPSYLCNSVVSPSEIATMDSCTSSYLEHFSPKRPLFRQVHSFSTQVSSLLVYTYTTPLQDVSA